MRKFAAILAALFSLAACEPTGSSIFLPMEPTQGSIDARRRELTDPEKEAISDAVMAKLQDTTHRNFRWEKLILRLHDRVMDYCALVSELDLREKHEGYRRFYAQLSFDRRGKLANVDVVSIDGPAGLLPLPTTADSICIQGGYNPTPPRRVGGQD
jgi:hypothetical protein